MKRYSRQYKSFSHEEIKRLKESEQSYLLGHLECGVCMTVTREPLDTDCCEDGHYTCSKCMAKWRISSRNSHLTCPTCKKIYRPSRNLFMQRYLERYYLYNEINCKNNPCPKKDLKVNLEGENHEDLCVHRSMKCPGSEAYRQDCDWNGSVEAAGKHITENRCGRICLANPTDNLDKLHFFKVV